MNMQTSTPVPAIAALEVETWIRDRIGEMANVQPENVPADADFHSFGIDSARAISIMMNLEGWLDLPDELPLELLFEADSIREAGELIAAEANNIRSGRNGQPEAGG